LPRAPAARERLLGRLYAEAPARFFAGCTDETTAAEFAKCAPQARERVLASAEAACLGRFDLLGYRDLCFGDPVDWLLDPVSGRRSSLAHWSAIDPTDFGAVGDCKVIWELNRHQFLVTLGMAYRATGDERYADAFTGVVREWGRANPPGRGINWASSLEVSLRLMSWCWALSLFHKSPRVTPDTVADVVAQLANHAAHVERYLSHHFSPNTHLTGEALGLFHAGVLFPELKSAARWRALGQAILEQEISRQVASDGVYFEQSTGYQRYTIEIYLHYLVLAGRNGVAVSKAVGDSLQRMLDVLLALRRPDGGLPAIGDADGGGLLPRVPRGRDDVRGVFATAAVVFERSDYAWAAEGMQPEALWLLGPTAVAAFGALRRVPPARPSRAFPTGGYVVMRSGWRSDAHHLVLDVGPLGGPDGAPHGHADLLSVQVSAFGEPWIVDPGTYCYCADRDFRDYFRGSGAHATAQVDGQGQAEPAGPFAWHQRPQARLRRFVSTPEFDFADGSHDGYRRLADPVVHRRRVAFVRSPGYWVLVDDLIGSSEHDVRVRFPLAPVEVSAEPGGWLRAAGRGGRGLLLRAFARVPLQTRVATGSRLPLEGWVSPDYGQRVPAPVVSFGSVSQLPLRIVTLLLPVAHRGQPVPQVRPWLDADGDPCGLSFGSRQQSLRFGSDAFSLEVP